ncbi:MAG: beta-exotoxin transport system ATP-binding protein [Eubacteriaceae bacterium]|jgi:ABC-2 type transport system ATP-binding protein|nr:beta-exotoxin transport system ATP-binding protein [Eubacteriaceae bacterium]MDK2904129.1 beta-exotoxin transport system ATP-binding protein [Eubacteriaceae bacterium]MDK2935051.1 beta-exotoxin transport system ATP-binding protein [Eubacteriaceae bacterium]MDN5306818.1 beta-exotoxin transport system ATP-binding protein [Eubacteriaceae bacterium]
MIKVNHATLTYRSGKGVFDLDFKIGQGQVMGYLGPNGAGKTTTIRQLTGFMKSDSGSCSINGLDCFHKAPAINQMMGYIPGEIAFLEGMQGEEYLKYIRQVRGLRNDHLQKKLIDMFEFSPKGSIRKFSKGMKQKLGIVAAFMHDPDVLLLDEPTSGLDPLMQNRFIDLILEEKKRGKTILLSSHMFEEVERTCDRVIIIKDGRIVAKSDIKSLKSAQRKVYRLKVKNPLVAMQSLQAHGFEVKHLEQVIDVTIPGDQIGAFVAVLPQLEVTDLDVKSLSLEEIFLHFYQKEDDDEKAIESDPV